MGSELEPFPLKEDPAPGEQRRAANPGSKTLKGCKELVGHHRTVLKVIERICDESDLFGEWSTEMLAGLLDATRGLLNSCPQRNRMS